MATISSPSTLPVVTSPQWKSDFIGASVQRGGDSIPLDTTYYGTLPADINEMVNNRVFQAALDRLPPTIRSLDITITIIGDTLKVTEKHNPSRVLLDTTTLAATEKDTFKETITKVNTLATTYLDTIAPSSRTSYSPEESARLCQEYGVKGMDNCSLYCYANSAAQLLTHIPSLKEDLVDQLKELEEFEEFEEFENGQALVENINTYILDPSNPITTDQGQDATEVLQHLTSSVPSFRAMAARTYTVTDEDEEEDTDSVADPTAILNLTIANVGSRQSVPFKDILANAFTASHDGSETHEATGKSIVGSKLRFNETPKHLFLKVGRIDTRTIDKKEITDIPLVLDLCNYESMTDDSIEVAPLYLKGFTIHSGTGQGNVGGHYTACFQKPHPSTGKWQWFHADDTRVTAITEAQALEMSKKASDIYYDDQKPISPDEEISQIVRDRRGLFSGFMNALNQNDTSSSDEDKKELLLQFYESLETADQNAIAKAVGQELYRRQQAGSYAPMRAVRGLGTFLGAVDYQGQGEDFINQSTYPKTKEILEPIIREKLAEIEAELDS
jgi:hypothetical protein